MKAYLFLSVLLLSIGTVFCQDLAMETPLIVNGPNISWDTKSFDFGTLEKDKPATINFTFSNIGNEAVIIERVRTSCGCTASDYPKKPIAPGETASIKVGYNSKSIGSFAKTITVYSNAVEPVSVLKIKGTVN